MKNSKTILACTIGTALEWYDFAVFGAMTPILSQLFFPTISKMAATLATFAVFATGFIARPIGGMIFGYIGDKWGRKKAVLMTITLMVFATSIIGLLPTYNTAGIYATMFLVLMRVFQGLSCSGEHTGTITLLSEIAPVKNKYFCLSFGFFGVIFGMLGGSCVSALIIFFFSENELLNYAWRLPFLFGVILGGCGLYLRLKINESPMFQNLKSQNNIMLNPVLEILKYNKSKLLLIVGMFCLNAVSFYSLFVYLPTELMIQNVFQKNIVFSVNSLNIFLMALSIPIIGLLSDKYGYSLFLNIGAWGFIIFTYPLLVLIYSRNSYYFMISQCILGLFNAFFLAPTPGIYTELFPNSIRYSGISLAVNFSAALFGGTAPLIMAYLSGFQNAIFLQSFYIMIAAIFALTSIKANNRLMQKQLDIKIASAQYTAIEG